MRRIAILFLFILLSFTVSYADIFKYVDENGVLCYTDTPLNRKANRILKEKTDKTPVHRQSVRSDFKDAADYHSIVHEKAAVYNMDPSLIKAVIKTESNWNSKAISRKGAVGLMQLMPSTASDMNVHNPFNPEENIEGGTRYLKYLIERFNGDITLALAAYNAGPKTVEKFGYVPPITETKQYVSRVLSLYSGRSAYASTESDSTRKENKPELIYKIILEDGTVLFTNSTLLLNNTVRF
jgi:hypothetical protein